jgi:cell division initiation protein
MKGYKPDEVNAYLEEVADTLASVVRERAELQEKLEVLAEKLEEYRGDEESLRAALIGAQKLGDSVVKEAKSKADAILAEASHKADNIVGDAKRNMDAEAYALSKMKLEVAKFKTQILNMYKKQVELINAIPYDEGNLPPMPPGPAQKIKDDIPPEVVEEVQAVEEEIKLEYEQVTDEAGDTFPQRGSRFGTLRFGEDYELKRNE